MGLKTYMLTIEYNEDTEEIEYIQEEIIEPDEPSQIRVLGALDLEERFDEDSLDIIREFYTGEVGES